MIERLLNNTIFINFKRLDNYIEIFSLLIIIHGLQFDFSEKLNLT